MIHYLKFGKTIEHITPDNVMVFLWSCWWFQNIWNTLDKSKEAQIISTKWTWVKIVNDTLFKIINNKILEWKDINWEEIWTEASKTLWNNKDFQNYVRPDKNIWVMFSNKYNEIE